MRDETLAERQVDRAWSAGDGRFIDPAAGALAGEAAQQRVDPKSHLEHHGKAPGAAPGPGDAAWQQLPSSSFGGAEPSYYGRPLVKAPVWIWSVPLYFYVGGAAGASAVLGAAAQLAGGVAARGLVRRCRRVAAGGTAAGSLLLIHDLGRPERFLNMLRVFRPSSPMSVGSWVLAGAGAATMTSALLADRRGLLGWVGDAAGIKAALLGLPLAGYTGVLLGGTAIPLWQATRRSLPPLFAASAVSGAASLFDLFGLPPHEERIVRRFGIAGKAADLAAIAILERQAGRVPEVAKPLREGPAALLWSGAKVLTAASLALTLASAWHDRRRRKPQRETPRSAAAGASASAGEATGAGAAGDRAKLYERSGRPRGAHVRERAAAVPPTVRKVRHDRTATALRLAAGILGTAGALALRFGIFQAGKASARDPRASFQQQRAGYGARELAPHGAGEQ